MTGVRSRISWAAILGGAVVTLAASLMMVGAGLRTGYRALVGTTMVAQQNPQVQQRNWEDWPATPG